MAGKKEIAESVAAARNLHPTEAERIVECVIDAINEKLGAGEVVQLRRFGTFKTVTRAARTSRNPQTGEAIQVPERTVIKFKASK